MNAIYRELGMCERGLRQSQRLGWQDGIDHYTKRKAAAERRAAELAHEYDLWATGVVSEISNDAMCHGSAKYRVAHPELCATPPAPPGRPKGHPTPDE